MIMICGLAAKLNCSAAEAVLGGPGYSQGMARSRLALLPFDVDPLVLLLLLSRTGLLGEVTYLPWDYWAAQKTYILAQGLGDDCMS